MKKLSPLLYLFSAAIVVIGLAALVAGLGIGKGGGEQNRDMAMVTLGGMLFSLGLFLSTAGMYAAASTLKSAPSGGGTQAEAVPVSKKFKMGNCAVCKNTPAIVRCMTHLAPLCANCMMKHDNATMCEYIPMNRKAPKSGGGVQWG